VRIVSLLTDFGQADTYVGQMKAALLAIAPSAVLVDLTHAVPAQDIFAGAFLLWAAVEAFPEQSLHLAVVDPGVGSARRALAVRTGRGDMLIGPDNGLLWPAACRLGGIERAVSLTERRFWRTDVTSATFHGRDIFAPVTGHLHAGARLEDVGLPVADPVSLELPVPSGSRGEVLHVDAYGNLITNLLADLARPGATLRIGAFDAPLATHYQDVAPGSLLAVLGSANLLEISVRDGSAARVTGARRGTPVHVVPRAAAEDAEET
jgi:S-adenosylmethionine hydrolase